eukprot:TRINITY_DN15964_c0_g1_i4.p1 TRINITY_DN15964_c0_g1~~TRINITY_DN15964_c0_g1_i4.p1  ORF type:complete len:339 (-),score=97.20 TRINITY_DN15964_c0_g1_i4:120-998(-)
MSLTRFLAFIRDSELAKSISNTEAELIFIKSIGTTNERRFRESVKENGVGKGETEFRGGKMSFDAFQQALSAIAEKMHSELPSAKALLTLVEKDIRNIELKNESVEKSRGMLRAMFGRLREEKTVDLLSWLSRMIRPYFSLYTHSNALMDYEAFLKFSRDFAIFPQLCSKLVLHTNFHALAFINMQVEEGKSSGEHLDENLFVEALALCALRSKVIDKSSGTVEQILHFVEKIAQSQGIINAKKRMGNTRVASGDIDPLIYLRQRYSEYFEMKFAPNDSEEVLDEALNNKNP